MLPNQEFITMLTKNPLLIFALWNPDQTLIFYSSRIILGASAKQRNTTICFIMLVCPSVRQSHWTRFPEIWYFTIFWESVKQTQVLFKSIMTNSTLHKDHYKVSILFRSRLPRVKNVSEKIWRENPNTHFIFNNMSFENRAAYEIMWKILYKRTDQRRRNTAHANRMLYT